ncbi:MAG: Na(+)-translocating NADH-quinone reductase subunit A [Betaproteobacteria bacterium]|nr:Na(+)-translocating NADH-quinone reductase subunit A [Betaproteobacteria bacterium]
MIAIRRGIDLPLAGAPDTQDVSDAPACRIAALGADFIGLKPTLLVQPGDRVRIGQPLFEDKKAEGVVHTATAAGRVVAINRGDKRAFVSLVIEVEGDESVTFASYAGRKAEEAGGDYVRKLLAESGLWTAFRARPFSRVPATSATPDAIFVTAIDTRPHAPSPDVALAGRESDFATGLLALRELTPGTVYVCRRPDSRLSPPAADRLKDAPFSGPHPAGNAGTHIHFLHPVGHGRTVWHIAARDVAAIGHLLATGRLDTERIIAVSGPGIANPRLVRTRLGASIDDLVAGNLAAGEQRIVSGSVLDGRRAQGEVEGYLGRYHAQVCALPEGRERELFGWIAPGAQKFSITRSVVGAFTRAARPFTTTTNGSIRAMVPIGTYEKLMPLDIMPTFLLRSLLTGDIERAEALGALELDEEDLALCTYTCPGKNDYGPLLRKALARLEKEA